MVPGTERMISNVPVSPSTCASFGAPRPSKSFKTFNFV